VRSKAFRHWLTHKFFERFEKPPGSQALQDALGVLEARARFSSPECGVFTRVAPLPNNGICIDLCNDNWQAIEIHPDAWHITDHPPVYFRRAKGMLPLPCPIRGGSMEKLRSLLDIGDDKNWILLLAWLLAACRPTGPFPVWS
jgi:hypothetical protein